MPINPGGGGGGGGGGSLTDVYNVISYGADPTGTVDSTTSIQSAANAAKAVGGTLFIPAGVYLTSATLDFTGSFSVWAQHGDERPGLFTGARIHCTASNIPIVNLGGNGQYIHGLWAEFTTIQPSANTNAFCFNWSTGGAWSRYEMMTAVNGAIGFNFNPSTYNPVFSCSMDTWRVMGYSISAILWGSSTSESTGCVFSNLYTTNNYNGTAVACTGTAVSFSYLDECVVNQLNVEHCLPATIACAFFECKNAVVNGLHEEALTLTAANARLLDIDGATQLTLNGWTLRSNTFAANLGAVGLIGSGGGGASSCNISSIIQVSNTFTGIAGTTVYLWHQTYGTPVQGYYWRITQANTSGLGGMVNGDFGAPYNVVVEINNTVYSPGSLGTNPPVSGTVYQAPTVGRPQLVTIPITATAIGGSAQLALGPTSAPSAFGGPEDIGVSGETHNVTFILPPGWYWSITVTSATIGTASVLGM